MMAHIESSDSDDGLVQARHNARQHAQIMLVAAGLAAFGIVAVAATMITTLL